MLGPLAYDYAADLYLPSGEISNTMLATMAKTGADDGREMIVLVFADADPAGYQMGLSIAHKLRAMCEGLYPNLRFRVLTPALTVEQVASLALPNTPLKPTEKRADGWRERCAVEQCEIDALATLRPSVLGQIVRNAIAPYYDDTLYRRNREAIDAAMSVAQAELDRQAEGTAIPEIQTELARYAEDFRTSVEATQPRLRAALAALSAKVKVKVEVVEPVLAEPTVEPLVASDMALIDHIRALRARKDYGNGGES